MPTKHQKRVTAGKKAYRTRVRRELHGTGFFGDLWNGVKSVGSFVRDNKLLSRGLGMIPNPGAQRAGAIAGQLGFGRKRRIRRRAVMGVAGMPRVNHYYAPVRRPAGSTILPSMIGAPASHLVRL